MKRLFCASGLMMVIAGCGVNPGVNPEPIEIEGLVTIDRKSVSDVTLNLQATGKGAMATLPVSNGKAKGVVTPGQYTYYLSQQGSNSAAFNAVPEKYRAGALDRQVEIRTGGSVSFPFE